MDVVAVVSSRNRGRGRGRGCGRGRGRGRGQRKSVTACGASPRAPPSPWCCWLLLLRTVAPPLPPLLPQPLFRTPMYWPTRKLQGPEGATLTWTWSSLHRPPLAGHTGCLAVYSVVVTHGVDWRFPGVSQLPPQLLEKAMPPRSGGGLSRSGACACTVLRCACAGAPLLALQAGAGLASSLRPLSCPPPRPPPSRRGLARSPPAGSGWPGRVCPK